MKILTSILFATLILPAAARLGENPEQLVARYGPSAPGKDAAELFFEKNGIAITAILWKEFAIPFDSVPFQRRVAPDLSIRMTCRPPTALGSRQAADQEQRMQLLEANAGGSSWFEFNKSTWNTEDSKRNAFLLANGDFCIVTMEFVIHQV